MENIKIACGNNIDLFDEVEAFLMENSCLVNSLLYEDEYTLEQIEKEEGLNRSVYEYFEEDFSLMKCNNEEDVRKLLKEVQLDNRTLININYPIF